MIGPWPGSSPDLNPIVNLWMIMKRKVASYNPTSEVHPEEVIRQVWVMEITLDYCRKLARFMPDRIAGIVADKGYHIKY